jgi:hypothetical protein
MKAIAGEKAYQEENKRGSVSDGFNRGIVKGWFHTMSPDTF